MTFVLDEVFVYVVMNKQCKIGQCCLCVDNSFIEQLIKGDVSESF